MGLVDTDCGYSDRPANNSWCGYCCMNLALLLEDYISDRPLDRALEYYIADPLERAQAQRAQNRKAAAVRVFAREKLGQQVKKDDLGVLRRLHERGARMGCAKAKGEADKIRRRMEMEKDMREAYVTTNQQASELLQYPPH
jgi:hypothetical protein